MKKLNPLLSFVFFLFFVNLQAQEMINPVITNYGSIGDAPHASLKPDSKQAYRIVIDLASGEENKAELLFSLNNVARLLNLHVMGGVAEEQLDVVVAIHGGAIWAAMNNETYKKTFGVDNPNIELLKKLKQSGVRLAVCSQSLFKRKINTSELVPDLEVATSALTTLTSYQLKGYAVLKF